MCPSDEGLWPDCSKLLNLEEKKIQDQVFIPDVCRILHNALMSAVKIYHECVESYTTHLMSLVKTYRECVELYKHSSFTADKPESFIIVF
jgi:hypothetical protein